MGGHALGRQGCDLLEGRRLDRGQVQVRVDGRDHVGSGKERLAGRDRRCCRDGRFLQVRCEYPLEGLCTWYERETELMRVRFPNVQVKYVEELFQIQPPRNTPGTWK